MYTYRARVVKVVDGDTLHLQVDLGFDTEMKLTVRLMGINSPEMSTPEGLTARAFAQDWIAANCRLDGGYQSVLLRTVKDRKEKYGRYLGVIYDQADKGTLNDALLAAGHAVPYNP
jgi:micrococcal nuclease